MKFSILILTALIAAGAPRPAQAQGIVNGSFDTAVPSNSTGGGWTSATIDGAGGHRSSGGNPGGFFILNDSGGFGTDPTLSQVISGLGVGLSYTLSGDYRTVYVGQDTGGTMAFGVAIDSTFLFESPGVTDSNWRSFSFNFVAPASSVTLSLAAERNGTDNDFGVDNLALAQVPEPSAILLLTLGGGIWVARLGRREQRDTRQAP